MSHYNFLLYNEILSSPSTRWKMHFFLKEWRDFLFWLKKCWRNKRRKNFLRRGQIFCWWLSYRHVQRGQNCTTGFTLQARVRPMCTDWYNYCGLSIYSVVNGIELHFQSPHSPIALRYDINRERKERQMRV